jgi:NAD(P)-dependent dehydrogenase (short-subunit alcohol dehydrogenase family)
MGLLDGKVALVTGGSTSGIGRANATPFAQESAKDRMMADGRLAGLKKLAHVRRELGIDPVD